MGRAFVHARVMHNAPHRPVLSLSYRLGRPDALAFTMATHRLSFWEKFRLTLIIGVVGLAIGLLPEDMARIAWWSATAALMIVGAAAALLWSNIEVRRLAAAMPLAEGQVTVEQWGDRLTERSETGTRHVPMAEIVRVIASDRHVFLRTSGAPLIIPLAAFPDAEAMAAFARSTEEACHRARYGDDA